MCGMVNFLWTISLASLLHAPDAVLDGIGKNTGDTLFGENVPRFGGRDGKYFPPPPPPPPLYPKSPQNKKGKKKLQIKLR